MRYKVQFAAQITNREENDMGKNTGKPAPKAAPKQTAMMLRPPKMPNMSSAKGGKKVAGNYLSLVGVGYYGRSRQRWRIDLVSVDGYTDTYPRIQNHSFRNPLRR